MAATAIKSHDQLNRVISRLGVRLQRLSNRDARADAQVARARQKLDAAINRKAELNRREGEGINRDGAAIFAYVEPLLDELMGGLSEVDVGAGRLVRRHRNLGAVEFSTDEATAVKEVEDNFPELADEIIKTTKVIRKDILKKVYPEVLAALESTQAGSVDTLSIQPANTGEKLTLPFKGFRKLAETLGLI